MFSVGLATCLAIYIWPKGERVGDVDLQAPASALALDLSAGDALHFRVAVTVGTNAYPGSSRARRDAIYERLRASAITIFDAGPGGAALSTTCFAYDGKSTSSSGSSSEVSMTGIPITCTLAALAAGRHTIKAKVAWAMNAEIHAATLEVRRELAKR